VTKFAIAYAAVTRLYSTAVYTNRLECSRMCI